MSSKFLLPLLGFWLLLNQPCRARVSEEWLNEVIKVCDRTYVRTVIEICGTSLIVDRKEPARRQRSITGAQGTMHCGARLPLPELQQHATTTEQFSWQPGRLEKGSNKTQGEAEASGPPETNAFALGYSARRKRQSRVWLSYQCCHFGCPRRAIAQYC
ncbi:LOW QUALITY PROTEIN: prorelaxin 1-like [Arvicola amphibius]|uniref:LOW QUALITY PROTEIN: prorelaxin 1-like n=1 Tax=Arvicola amphibius TaxID=1047088 RepID=UPI001C0A39DB|nr:LOW QUALITY PROTEIN: prorelaxin 1-like [Arvicola amphibius]